MSRSAEINDRRLGMFSDICADLVVEMLRSCRVHDISEDAETFVEPCKIVIKPFNEFSRLRIVKDGRVLSTEFCSPPQRNE